jgi:hypothetical protein
MDPVNVATYVAFEEYYAQLRRVHLHVRQPAGPFNDRRNAKHFAAIAKWCTDNHINVREFITVMFPVVRATCRTLLPADFNKGQVFDEFVRLQSARLTETPANFWGLFVARLKQVLWLNPNLKTPAEVLRMASMPFSAWFRIMYLDYPVDEKLMHDYAGLAWDELKQDRLLRDFLRKQCPDNFRALESRVCAFGDGDNIA